MIVAPGCGRQLVSEIALLRKQELPQQQPRGQQGQGGIALSQDTQPLPVTPRRGLRQRHQGGLAANQQSEVQRHQLSWERPPPGLVGLEVLGEEPGTLSGLAPGRVHRCSASGKLQH